MKCVQRLSWLTLVMLMAWGMTPSGRAAEAVGSRFSMDRHWKFLLGDPPAARTAAFDDSTWRGVDLPHDWSIEGRIDKANPAGGSGAFLPTGVGWYRRTFTAAKAWQAGRVVVEFEGVYMNADVYLNGRHLGSHPYGYTSFFFDLTPYLNFAAPNVLAVRVDNSRQGNSRWYSGSGIDRHVWLTTTGPLHVAPWGVFVATPAVSAQQAKVVVQTRLVNDGTAAVAATLRTLVLDPEGKPAGQAESSCSLDAGASRELTQEITVPHPAPWSPETPQLYRAVNRVSVDGKTADESECHFGVRCLRWSVENGLQLNGHSVKLCGGCAHHDNGCLGAAAFDRAEQRKVEVLKAAGFNAIRTSHNPPSPAFLDACDRLGMLVIDEAFDCWEKGKATYDYHLAFPKWWQRDIDSMVLRDRNHPSVVMWSIGNEVPEQAEPSGARIAGMLADRARALDHTRPVTAAICRVSGQQKWTDLDPTFSALDIGGYNYEMDHLREDHGRVPARIFVVTESLQMQRNGVARVVKDNPCVVGDFVWTAIDYLGESGLGGWYYENAGESHGGDKVGQFPWHGTYCGDLDLCGFRKWTSHYRNILWNRGEKLYIAVRRPDPPGKTIKVVGWGAQPALASWTWPAFQGKPIRVDVLSVCDRVRLFLNGKLIGESPTYECMASFNVPYAPGTLKAVGLSGKQPVVEAELRTAGDAAAIRLTPDRSTIQADGQDLSFLTVEVTDHDGVLQQNAANNIHFSLAGPGTIAGVANADMAGEEPYQGDQRRVVDGRALLVIRSTRQAGNIRVKATAQGLREAEMAIEAQPAPAAMSQELP